MVRIVDAETLRDIYGFCGFSKPRELTPIWFAVPRGDDPPPSVQVVMIDQLTGVDYRSTILELTGD